MLITLAIILAIALAFGWPRIRRLLRVNSLFAEKNIVGNFSNMRRIFFHIPTSAKSSTPLLLPPNPRIMPETFEFRGDIKSFETWQTERAVTAIVVLKNAEIAHEDYRLGTRPDDLRISWSMAKSLLSAAFGIAVRDGLIPSLDAQVVDLVPSLKGTAYDRVTIRNVLQMASGVDFNEDYLDFHSDINRMGRVLALGRSMDKFAASIKQRVREPGNRRQYVSIDTHVLGMVLRAATGTSVPDYMSKHLFKPMQLEADPVFLADGHGVAFVLGGLNMCTRDYARFGLLFSQDGVLNGREIVPKDWVRTSTTASAPPPAEVDAVTDAGALGYGYQWWLPPEATEGEFFALGIYGQYIYVNRPENVVIAVNSADRNFKDGDGRITLENIDMFRAIVARLR